MKLMRIQEFADRLGVRPETVRKWERMGKIYPVRTEGGHRRYKEDDMKKMSRGLQITKRNVMYCNISHAQGGESLDRIKRDLEMFAIGRGIEAELIIEVGNYNGYAELRKLKEIVAGIVNREIESVAVMVTHENMLTVIGFELLKDVAEFFGCEVIAINDLHTMFTSV